jgi:ergothioneine biosynthesis protein EgtB
MNMQFDAPVFDIENNDAESIRKILIKRYKEVRGFTHKLCEPLVTEDYIIQSMPDVSPTKWHLAHTSWFFEAFVLSKADENYRSIHPLYTYLFNSYYVQVGERFTRAERGLLSRPTVKEVYDYRKYVDEHLLNFLKDADEKTLKDYGPVIEIGLNHEQQHQELLLTDIKHVFSVNPLNPVYKEKESKLNDKVLPLNWKKFEGGVFEIGHGGNGFTYDNETPRHKEYLEPFELACRLTTNGEFIKFMEAGGYEKPELWLSDGWATVEKENWKSPMYWYKKDGEWYYFTLNGVRKVDLNEPVCHVSFYEADAFARWTGARLPTEAEWETAAGEVKPEGNFVESMSFHPVRLDEDTAGSKELQQMYGDVWEWTRSSYSPYPGYKTLPGALGEYNGKFMSSQMVLRGGSCATSITHIRKTYRNFFAPHSRWQFMGIRLAKDVS